ncbi:hypothetical protein ACET3X_003837 [Alternaria dauci]|uniref:BTB domain-containing protein n=1 Tax=Alternaria dauci TaxID=48095 RepID=A0ABR3UL66_9PLEO
MISEVSEATVGDVVAIAIGPQKQVFQVHKEILCKKSEYFRTAYNGRWKEAEEGVTLEDVEVGVFKFFVHWLYTQQLPDYDEDDEDDESENGEDDSLQGLGGMLLKACAFGHRFLIKDFERITHNRYVKYFMHCTWYTHVIYAYNNLPAQSLLLKLMVEKQCINWSSDFDNKRNKEEERRHDLPKEFLIQVMVRFAERRDNIKNPEELRAEDFYMKE